MKKNIKLIKNIMMIIISIELIIFELLIINQIEKINNKLNQFELYNHMYQEAIEQRNEFNNN